MEIYLALLRTYTAVKLGEIKKENNKEKNRRLTMWSSVEDGGLSK